MHKWLLAAVVVVMAGCESGTARQVEVTVPSDIASTFSATAPGVVVTDLGADAGHSFTLLCGQTTQTQLTLEQDLGFGCLSKTKEGTTESVKVWVEPMPTSWDAASLCSKRTDRSFYQETSFAPVPDAGSTDGGVDGGTVDDGEGVAATPSSSWVQASGSGTWKRDGSPCGGLMNVKVTLAKP
ncbi:MAG: hypothetical protein QM723_26640 [Myxococcaceae bacterium]